MHLLYAAESRIDAYLVKALREAGHLVEIPDDPVDGAAMAASGNYDAIIIDWSSPAAEAVAGFAAVASSALLVVMIAAGGEGEQAALLEAGADACFARPVAFIELEERLKALWRLVERTRPAIGGDLEMAAAIQAIRLNGREIVLSRREFRVMSVLAAHAGEVVGFEQLQQQAWGEADEPRPDLVQACLSRLRRKLDAAGAGLVLKRVGGHGYVLRSPAGVSADAAPANMKMF